MFSGIHFTDIITNKLGLNLSMSPHSNKILDFIGLFYLLSSTSNFVSILREY